MGSETCHKCAPKEWRKIPNLTGDYDLDGTIQRRTNPDIPRKLDLYLRQRPVYGSRVNHEKD